ncbi:MAG: hypothetical protein ABIJ08_01815 [Nanoarchaeota archaeon]
MVHVAKSIDEIKIKYKDVFHLKNLYVMLHEYLYEEGWMGMPQAEKGVSKYASNAHSNIEKMYLEKFTQKGLHSGGKEMWIWWRLYKMPDSKFSAYFRYRLDIDWHMVYVQDREVIHQGKKMKVQWAEIEMMLRGFIEADYKNEWENHWFLKHVQEMYENRIMSQELEKREKELWREIYRLQGVIKRYWNLRTFVPVPEPFHPAIYGQEGEPSSHGPMPVK